MRLNSPEQLKTGEDLIKRYGSWSNVRKNSVLINGVYVVDPKGADIERALKRLKDH